MNFERSSQWLPSRAIKIIIAAIVFTSAWHLLPQAAMYWLLLVAIVVLVWMASYGWRNALAQLIIWLNTLDRN